MLTIIRPGTVTLGRTAYMPPFLHPLAGAAMQETALEPLIEVDPRVKRASEGPLPLVWDQASEQGRSDRLDAFLADSAAHGVASGIAFGVHDLRAGVVLIALSSTNPVINDARHSEISRDLGNILLLGIYFHEIFMSG